MIKLSEVGGAYFSNQAQDGLNTWIQCPAWLASVTKLPTSVFPLSELPFPGRGRPDLPICPLDHQYQPCPPCHRRELAPLHI